jgi:hypothetical protein
MTKIRFSACAADRETITAPTTATARRDRMVCSIENAPESLQQKR